MNPLRILLLMAVLCIAAAPAAADWEPVDGHKMHWPQTPKQGGCDVEFGAGEGWALGDDWQCTESGYVDEIHFWISWNENLVQDIAMFTISIFADIPADQNPDGYSKPGELLWIRDFTRTEVVIRDMEPDLQDWFDPSGNAYYEDTHDFWQQVNVVGFDEPFEQVEGTIYWLVIDFHGLPFIGWKETDQNFNDDGVWWDRINDKWQELRHPIEQYSIDLAFVVNTEGGTASESTTISTVKSLY
ncbi:MAG: hypothetical protein GY835_12560 [bacterium]|nr:hypothetical protein [bacterium]